MEYLKDKIRLAPLTGTDQIDANQNPYELINNLVNVAPLATFLTGHPRFLLQVPESSPDPPSWSQHFSLEWPVMNLKITFPQLTLLSEVQLFYGGENVSEFPEDMTVIVSRNWASSIKPPVRNSIIAPAQRYIWIQLEKATLAQSVSLCIRKPIDSFVVHLTQIRLLEQTQGNVNLDILHLHNRLNESNIRIPHLIEYCHVALMDPGSSKILLVRVIAVLVRFGGNVSSAALTPTSPDSTLLETVEALVHDLCSLPNGQGLENLQVGLRRLDELISHTRTLSETGQLEGANTFMYMRAISSALWSLAEEGNGRVKEVESILTRDLVQKLYDWSMKLKWEEKDERKTVVVDYVICSVCYCRPSLFLWLMYSMELVKVRQGTDLNGSNHLEEWFTEDNVWTKLEPNESPLSIDLSDLSILGRCAESPTCAKILKESGVLESSYVAIYEFCKAGRTDDTSKALIQLANILRFVRTLSFLKYFRTWFGATQDFWFPVLKFMSTPPEAVSLNLKPEMMEVEAAVIDLLKTLCWAHPENQGKIIPAVRQVISKEDIMSAFSRKLLEQLLLEDCAFVRVRSGSGSESKISFKPHDSRPRQMQFHPSLGVPGKDCIFLSSVNSTAEDILEMMENSRNLHLRLASRPNVQVPLHLPIKILIAAFKQDQLTKGHPSPYLDALELTLCKERRAPDQDFSNIVPYPSSLEVFSKDGGMLLLFQKVSPNIPMGISPDIIHSLRHFLDCPRYTEVLFNYMFMYRTDCLIRLVLGQTDDVDGEAILNSPVFETLESLPFEAINWLLELETSSSPSGQSEILRRKMVDNKAFEFVLGCLDRLEEGRISKVDDYDDENKKGDEEKREERMICLFNILTNFMTPLPLQATDTDPSKNFQAQVFVLLDKSSVINRVSDNLRNDSVLDIANHVPRYQVILQLLRALAAVPEFRSLLVSGEGVSTIFKLLLNMKATVVQYFQFLDASNSNIEDVDLANLVKDIDATVTEIERAVIVKECQTGTNSGSPKEDKKEGAGLSHLAPLKTPEERYVEEMKNIQFRFIEMIADGQVFKLPFHFENEALQNWKKVGIHSIAKRLAQEVTTLSKSLPLSYGSSIFLRCDNDHLDVIKVLITGAAGTPYANGCFEFDVYFPMDYPNFPPKVNCITAKGIRFVPHIYTDGQICLTLLNTWGGSKEERWNPKTSSLLPALVAIQSVILAEDPVEESQDFYAEARYCTLQHAILEQIREPPECWKEAIHCHFWLKREEILAQCEQWSEWSSDMESESRSLFKKTVSSLKTTLMKMRRPDGLKPGMDLEFEESPPDPVKKPTKRGLPIEDDGNGLKKKKENANCCVQ